MAGKGAESRLWEFVSGRNEEFVMPPEGEGDPLSAEEIERIKKWIDQGADWPADAIGATGAAREHWAFQPLMSVQWHAGARAWDVRGPIDALVAEILAEKGVDPSGEADRGTLIRRLSLDLLGLPPTPGELAEFCSDSRADAYERLVDRLLASARFGERWGRIWLDQARYADSDGYEKDTPRPYAWRWRDWVIAAINADHPFDEFTMDQIAGDLRPEASLEQRLATGFHRNTLTNKEGGVDAEEYRVKATVDRVSTTGTVWLGLTLGCAECHSHKYDPIPQQDFYGLYAFFNGLDETDIPAPRPDEEKVYERARRAYEAEHAPLAAAVDEYRRTSLPARQAEWESSLTGEDLDPWVPLIPTAMTTTGGTTLGVEEDGAILATGDDPATDAYVLEFQAELSGVTALRMEALPDARLPTSGPGRSETGNFVVTELRLESLGSAEDGSAVPGKVEFKRAWSDYSQDKFPVSAAIDGKADSGWAVAPHGGKPHVAVFEIASPLSEGVSSWRVIVDQQHGERHTLGRFRLSATRCKEVDQARLMTSEAASALRRPAAERSAEAARVVVELFEGLDPEFQRLQSAQADHAAKAPAAPRTLAPVLVESTEPRITHVHVRGDFLQPGAQVEPHTLSALHALRPAGARPTRLDLAHWLVDPANPLTPRVTANRVWQTLFGKGLVATPEDFGTRSEPPVQAELLDYLAASLLRHGWSVKSLVREIVVSSTYRQSSVVRSDLAERDPQNEWLARQNRFRLDAELIRDRVLVTSGLLAGPIGGPSVRPPQPAGISELTYADSAKWEESVGADRYRRGMYTHFQRTSPYPMLVTFDAPDSNVCAVKRERSNTPLQALTLLNDPVFVEGAQALARRILPLADDSGDDQRLRQAMRIALSRHPSEREIVALRRLLDAAQATFHSDADSAVLLGGEKDHARAAESAAWVTVCRALYNLDEFVTRD